MILAVTADMPLDQLAELADLIEEHVIPGVSSVTGTLPLLPQPFEIKDRVSNNNHS